MIPIRSSLAIAVLLSSCASYNGRGLNPGEAKLDQVLSQMGTPAQRWNEADGSIQLSYPKGPAGPESYMVRIGPDGKLQNIRNVMTPETFKKILPGMSKEEVVKILGPSVPAWTNYFKARDELVWTWRYELHTDPAFFHVLFDASSGKVRSSMIILEELPLP